MKSNLGAEWIRAQNGKSYLYSGVLSGTISQTLASSRKPTMSFAPAIGIPLNPMYSPVACDLINAPPLSWYSTIHFNDVSASAEAVEGTCDAYRLADHRLNVLADDSSLFICRKVKGKPGPLIQEFVWFTSFDRHGVMMMIIGGRCLALYMLLGVGAVTATATMMALCQRSV